MASSRLSGFYKRSISERINELANWLNINSDQVAAILDGRDGLSLERAGQMIENAVGIYSLPLGIATNFQINGKDYLIPMVIEEPSVVAACSFAAKLVREGGGFKTHSDDPMMVGQIQVLNIPDMEQATAHILSEKQRLLDSITNQQSSIVKLGGGPKDIEIRQFTHTDIGQMLVLHLLYDTRDAMGANVVNTACELLGPEIEKLTDGTVHLRILSNYSDHRMATARCRIPSTSLATAQLDGDSVIDGIYKAAVFAEVDPYRAVTHNKGVMNGVDAVVIATGNDWRAVEAAAHAHASRNGQYTSMTRWWKDENGDLIGELSLPIAVGIVGGATRVHPTAQLALEILEVETAQELAEILVAVGLAQNLAAIRALATEGIQAGHMALHARQVALAAGATPEQVEQIATKMIEEGNIRLEFAGLLLQELNSENKE